MGIYSIPTILNELYLGKNKDIKELQSHLSNLRRDAMENDTLLKKTGNTSPYLQKFNRKCEDIFGFKTFSMTLVYSPLVNAMTLPIQVAFDINDVNKNFAPTKDNMKYKKEAGYCTIVLMFTGLFLDPKYTDEEMLAIILHEIGHNFTDPMSQKSAIFNNIRKAIMIVDDIITFMSTLSPAVLLSVAINTNTMKTIMAQSQDRFHSDNKQGTMINDFIINSFTTMAGYAQFMVSLLNIMKDPANYTFSLVRTFVASLNPIRLLNNFMGYNNEKLSDSFATIYGYGPELSSGLLKMHYIPRSGVPAILECANTLMFLPFMILLAPTAIHPDAIVRVKTQIEYLTKEIANETDPKMKKELQDQIDEMNRSLDNIVLNLRKYKADYMIFNRLYSYILYNTFGGDIREILSRQTNHEDIQDSYVNALNNIKLK